MDSDQQEIFELTTKQKKNLRSLAHHLKPQAYIGREGITPNLIKAIQNALKAHELIKVKLGQNCPLYKQQAADEIALQSSASLVQVIGRMVVLYRPNKEKPKDKRIRP
jgi:RNA-binding protein